MSKTDQKETSLQIGLSITGFPKSMYFNRFRIERDNDFCVIQFGLVSASGLIDSYSCVMSKDMLKQNQASLLNYLSRSGQPVKDSSTSWNGTMLENQAQIADVISMCIRNDTAETCIYFFSLTGATKLSKGSTSNPSIDAQPLVLLRSTPEIQKQLIRCLYEE